jgi:hypothetical protein
MPYRAKRDPETKFVELAEDKVKEVIASVPIYNTDLKPITPAGAALLLSIP